MNNENEKCVVPVPLMSVEIAPLTATGDGGTNDYNKLKNHPSINDVPLISNKTLDELGIQPKGDYALKSEIPDPSDFVTTEDLNDYPKKEYVEKKFDGIDHDVENLTELVTENQDKLITSFATGKPDGTGLVKVSAVTKNGNIDALSVYNNVDGKYPYSAFGAQAGKDLNDKIVALQDNVLTKDNTTEYTPTTDYNPATKKYADGIKNDIPTALSQLTNDLLNESDSRESALQSSQQNPGKFYFWGGEE